MEGMEKPEVQETQALLGQLFNDSRLYTHSKNYQELLQFVARLPHLAPFNAMLLEVQRPGLHFAASAHDWQALFGRHPKPDARPLLILWPFGPVALVYDEIDTLGRELPRDVRNFYARGPVDDSRIKTFCSRMYAKHIFVREVDRGDRMAGSITRTAEPTLKEPWSAYEVRINQNQPPATTFGTIAHELGHLFLGHLGRDGKLHISERRGLPHKQQELEAESVSYLVLARNGTHSASEAYLATYVDQNTTTEAVDVARVMQAAGQVESLLGLSQKLKFAATSPVSA